MSIIEPVRESAIGEKFEIPWWGNWVLNSGFVGVCIIAWDGKFMPIWINAIPIGGCLLSLFIEKSIGVRIRPGSSRKLLLALIVFFTISPLAILGVDRFFDVYPPIVLPAEVLQFHRASRSVGSSLLIRATYPDGRTIEIPVGSDAFSFIPSEGAKGKVELGRGLLGISYLKRVEFEESTQ